MPNSQWVTIGFLISVAAGYFLQPSAVAVARRLWTHGLIGFWLPESTRRKFATSPVSFGEMIRSDPRLMRELQRELDREIRRFGCDLTLDERAFVHHGLLVESGCDRGWN